MTAAGKVPPAKVLVISTGVAGLAAIQTAEFTEQGAFYIDKSGNAIFKNRQFVYDET
jgi:NAD/NADP transhydrogenase alpha subunit